MVILITRVLLCAPLLTRAHCAPQQAGKGGNSQINSFFTPQWGPRDILVCRRPYRCSQAATGVRNGCNILREKKMIYQILHFLKKKGGDLGKLCFLRGELLLLSTLTLAKGNKHSKTPQRQMQPNRRFFFFFLPLKQPPCPFPEKGAALIKGLIFGEDIGTFWGNSHVQVLWFESFHAFKSPCSLQVGEGL